MIPDDIRRFIVQCIPSVPYLEALLLLRESSRQEWDGVLLAQRLYLDTATAEALLAQLQRDALVEQDLSGAPRYRYRANTPQLDETVAQLGQIYAKHLVEVSTLIHVKTNRKALVFADAFILRKKEL